MFLDTRNKVLFIHVPKSGGTSIVSALQDSIPKEGKPISSKIKNLSRIKENQLPQFPADRLRSAHKIGTHCSYNRLKKQIIENKIKLRVDDYLSFAFVRNPWERMYSYWNFLWQSGDKEINLVGKWSKYYKFRVLKDMGFNSWVSEFNVYSKKRKQRNKRHAYELLGDLHTLKPQASWTENVSFVGKLENIKEDLDYVSKKIGYDIPIYHIKKSIYSGDTYKDAYNQKSVDIVADLFGVDIETFGYSYH